jgi:ABC-type tungstate transport system permease subunit
MKALTISSYETLKTLTPIGEIEMKYFKSNNLEIKIIHDIDFNTYSFSIINPKYLNKLSFKEKENLIHDCNSFEDGIEKINELLKNFEEK